MEPYLRDTDATLYMGDCLDVLRELPGQSVHVLHIASVLLRTAFEITAPGRGRVAMRVRPQTRFSGTAEAR